MLSTSLLSQYRQSHIHISDTPRRTPSAYAPVCFPPCLLLRRLADASSLRCLLLSRLEEGRALNCLLLSRLEEGRALAVCF